VKNKEALRFLDWPDGVLLPKRDDRISSTSLGSTLEAQSKSEGCRRKTLFLLSIQRLEERRGLDVVSFRQRNTDRPSVPDVGRERGVGTPCFSSLVGL
jgi:hypothetical protein